MKHLTINPTNEISATRDHPQGQALAEKLPDAKETKVHPKSDGGGGENASLLFVGTATTVLEWEGVRGKGESFTAVHELDFFEDMLVDIESTEGKSPAIKVTGMPGKHVPPGVLGTLNDLVKALKFDRIYISGDTLLVDELKEIPKRYEGQNIDLMLIHLGGTTIPSPSVPLLMVTMDAEQGLGLVKLIDPDLTIPIHFDDYDVFHSPLEDFKKKIEEAGLQDKVVYLDRKDKYKFNVKG
ncbi:MAG: hypothetical protein Q9213_003247 [Squamulea squamosa]